MADNWAHDLHAFWFGDLDPSDWFGTSADLDETLRTRFSHVLAQQASRTAADFLDTPQQALPAIILFDQIPRNIYRGKPDAFAYDPLALAICKGVMDRQWDRTLPDRERQFAIMPLMHSEDIHDQQTCLAYCEKFLTGNASFARDHKDVIERFGRFPHRNAILGRTSSDEELNAIADGFSW